MADFSGHREKKSLIMKTSISLLLSFVLLTIAAGCADGGGATATAGAAVNSICPIMGGKIDGATSTEWDGKTVGFCCPPCVDEWNTMSDEEKAEALAGGESSDHGDHDHGDHDHDAHAEAGENHEDHGTEEAAETSEAEATPEEQPAAE